MTRQIRVGIDVGGTNTKAVAVDNNTFEIVGVGIVPTTHESELGVSQGVIDSFKKCITENGISADEVTFIAHSTTQATNALVEGDVAKVGIISVSNGGLVGFLSKKQANIGNINLDQDGKRKIESSFYHINKKDFNKETALEAIDTLIADGCSVIVASETFGVDEMEEEDIIKEQGRKKG